MTEIVEYMVDLTIARDELFYTVPLFILAYVITKITLGGMITRYVDFLLWTNGKPYSKKRLKKNPRLKGSYLKRPFKPWYEECYPEKTPSRDKFIYFLNYMRMQTALLYAMFILLVLFVIEYDFGIFMNLFWVWFWAYYAVFLLLTIIDIIGFIKLIPYGVLREWNNFYQSNGKRKHEPTWKK